MEREAILLDLLGFKRPLGEIREELWQFPWDSETELVELTAETAHALLERATTGELSYLDVQAWGELVECRLDIGFPEDTEELLRDFVYELANPLLEGVLDEQRASSWMARLRAARGSAGGLPG